MEIHKLIHPVGSSDAVGLSLGSAPGAWLDSTDWDASWILTRTDFDKLPEAARAWQHEGWATPAPELSPSSRGSRIEDRLSMGEDNAMRRQNSPGTHSSASKHPPLCHTPVSKTLPPPWLDFSFRVATHFETEATTVDVPDMGATELWTVSRGTWSGSLGIGTVVAGGYAQGHERTRSRLQRRETCRVDTMLKFRTEDEPPALLEMHGSGYMDPTAVPGGFKDAAGALAPERHRMVINLTSADERYASKVNLGVWVGSWMWRGEWLVIDVYRVT